VSLPSPGGTSGDGSGSDAGRAGSTDGDLRGSGSGEGDDGRDVAGTGSGGGNSGSADGSDSEPGFETTAGVFLPSMEDRQPLPGPRISLPEMADAGAGTGEAPGSVPGGSGGDADGQAGDDDADTGAAGSGRAGQGTLTDAEQVAILEAELERGIGDFDRMILEEQTAQREASREEGSSRPVQTAANDAADADYGRPMGNSSGGYSVGGGMGGGSPVGGSMPKNAAKFPPPPDIPDGDDDDVVARQLREAAMREPDPAVRERLWEEYRKYKGIEAP